jgi:ABC-2 type transport system ATP-binding protein
VRERGGARSAQARAPTGEPGRAGEHLLRLGGVWRSFGQTIALRDVSLTLDPGEILGLVGPNGAGKTTLTSIVTGILSPDQGLVEFDGHPVSRTRRAVRYGLGVAGQDIALYTPFTVRENIEFFCDLAGLRRADCAAAIAVVAEVLDLGRLLDRRVRELSGGEKRRAHVAVAVATRPRLLVLDEPTAGMDIASRMAIVDLVRHVASAGMAVLYSTHYLQEIEQLGATVALLDRGRIIAHQPLGKLLASHGSGYIEITLGSGHSATAPADHNGHAPSTRTVRLPTTDPARTLADFVRDNASEANNIHSVNFVDVGLDAVFLNLAGRRYSIADGTDGNGE